jgi:hypothetical protein
MERTLRILLTAALCAAAFITGFNAGMCVKVFLTRGVPVIHGGGEIMLLLAIPASIAAGYCIGRYNDE